MEAALGPKNLSRTGGLERYLVRSKETRAETLGSGVETQENKKIFVPLSKKDKNKKSNERWT